MQRGRKLRSRRKTFPQTPVLARKAMSNSRLHLGTTPVCLSALSHWGSSLDSCMDRQNVDLNPVDCWQFLQQKWINYLGSAKNYSLRSATMVRHIHDPCNEESRTLSKRGSWKAYSKQSVHWRNWEIKYSRFSLVKLWLSLTGWALARQEEKVFFSPYWIPLSQKT